MSDLSADDFPFDPNANAAELHGLEKLRAVSDRGAASMLFELYWAVEKRQHDKRFWREESERKRKEQREHEEWLAELQASCAAGTFGPMGVDLASRFQGEQLVTEVRRAGLERRR